MQIITVASRMLLAACLGVTALSFAVAVLSNGVPLLMRLSFGFIQLLVAHYFFTRLKAREAKLFYLPATPAGAPALMCGGDLVAMFFSLMTAGTVIKNYW